MVDEAIGDAGLVGDVRDAAGVEALPGEDADRGVEDQAALLGGLLGVARGHRRCLLQPRVGRGAAPGQRRHAAADLVLPREVEVCGDHGLRVGCRASTSPRGRRSSSARRTKPGTCSPIWFAAITKHWFSIARARSRTSQWSRVVATVNAAGTVRMRAPRPRARGRARGSARRSRRSGRPVPSAVRLSTARRRGPRGRIRGRRCRRPRRRRGGSCGTSRDLAVGADVDARVAELRLALDALGDRAGDQVDAELAGDRAGPRDRRAVERLSACAEVLSGRARSTSPAAARAALRGPPHRERGDPPSRGCEPYRAWQ